MIFFISKDQVSFKRNQVRVRRRSEGKSEGSHEQAIRGRPAALLPTVEDSYGAVLGSGRGIHWGWQHFYCVIFWIKNVLTPVRLLYSHNTYSAPTRGTECCRRAPVCTSYFRHTSSHSIMQIDNEYILQNMISQTVVRVPISVRQPLFNGTRS